MSKDLFVSSLLDVYGNCLNEKQRTVLEYYYNDDLSLSEIAENEGITRQGVLDLIKRSESQLRTLEQNCRYCEKFIKLKNLCESVVNAEDEYIKQMVEIIESL